MVVGAGVNPEYFLDYMSMDEISAIIDNTNIDVRRQWEMTRMLAFYTVAVQSKKVKQPEDLFKFEWETQKPKQEKKADRNKVDRNMKKIEKHLKKWQRKSIQ